MLSLPGMTDLSSYKEGNVCKSIIDILPSKKNILLASNDITENNLFTNGILQNILILYNLFELIGYKSYIIQYRKQGQLLVGSNDSIYNILNKYDIIGSDDLIKNPIPIHLYIEIGMSLDSVNRKYLRSIGAKIVKLYLGNILNIDIETVQNYPSIFFAHHIVGDIDDIWMSPHYKQNLEYGVVLNRLHLENKGTIVPYVWDHMFISKYSKHIQWEACIDWRQTNIIISDPNISFQKSYFYSLLLAEAFYKDYPEWKGNIILINGDKLQLQINATHFILENLSLYKENRVKLLPRQPIYDTLDNNKSSIFITHQWNNAFNYMTLELMYRGFPVLHNSDGWEDFGYYYSINNWNKAKELLYNTMRYHKDNISLYKSHTNLLLWKHSIHNPDIQSSWKTIIES
jgi:hypothetical protein